MTLTLGFLAAGIACAISFFLVINDTNLVKALSKSGESIGSGTPAIYTSLALNAVSY